MFQALSGWRKHRRYEKAATITAVDYFESETSHHAHRTLCRVIGSDEQGFVVRVCHGRTQATSTMLVHCLTRWRSC